MNRNYLLTQKLNEYHIIVVNMEGVDILCETTPPPNKKWSVFLKVDCGYPRTGIPADDENCINIAKRLSDLSDRIIFQGLYAHCGDSYAANSVEEVLSARDSAIEI